MEKILPEKMPAAAKLAMRSNWEKPALGRAFCLATFVFLMVFFPRQCLYPGFLASWVDGIMGPMGLACPLELVALRFPDASPGGFSPLDPSK